jgi:predicted RNA-binding Zn-ribbon protein involved in translation (DUF1610 family)
MFGHESKPSRIYSYKAKAPAEGLEAVGEQIHLAHRYRNRLIELERVRREQVEAAMREHAPDVARMESHVGELEAEAERLADGLRKRNQEARSRVATAEDRAAMKEAKQRLKEARAEHKGLRKAAFADEGLRATLSDIDASTLAAQKEARAASGLYWGTYLLIEQSLRDIRKGAPPRFRRWTGEGTVAIQFQGGLDWGKAMLGDDQRLKVVIQPLGPDADPHSRRSREKAKAVIWFRVKTDEDGRSPIWVKALFHLHRQPPPESRIKWAYLRRTLIGRRVVWEVQFVLQRDSWDRDDVAENGITGLDVGWRLVKDGLRVAYLMGGDGREESLILPSSWLDSWSKVESLQSIRDRHFDAIRDHLAAWLGERDGNLPEWVAERTAHLRQWRSTGRLAAVVWFWRENRFDGDDEIYASLEAWRKQERHLHDWQEGQRVKAIRRRDDLYRKFAAELRRSYRTIRIEDTDWKRIEARPGPEESDDARAARVNKRIAAPGRLLQIVKEAVAEVQEVSASFTTFKCHNCGKIDRFDSAANLFHTCSECGGLWDQDRNAAINLLRWEAEAVEVEPVEVQ